ncbi:unnamed protein product, partial [Schistosoma mattheei]
NSDDREAYLSAGAYDAGGSALIQRISQGHYHWGEYDTVVAHQSWESQVTKLRHILKERLPTIKNGRFGEDVMKLMSIHSNSIQLESTSIDGVPEIGLLDIILGQSPMMSYHSFYRYVRSTPTEDVHYCMDINFHQVMNLH